MPRTLSSQVLRFVASIAVIILLAVLSITGFTLATVFFLGSRFGFDIFDRRIDSALKDGITKLRIEFAERLANEMKALQEAHEAELKTLEDDLTKRITQQEQDLKTRSNFQYLFAQALAKGAEDEYAEATRIFRSALKVYVLGKPRGLFSKGSAAATIRNIFVNMQNEDKAKFLENAGKELADKLYIDLEDELALAAIDLESLGPLLKERKPAPSPTATAKPKTGETQPIEAPPAPAPKAEK